MLLERALLGDGGLQLCYCLGVGVFTIDFCAVIDELSMKRVMLVLFITGCVFLFSRAYIREDPNKDRFILLLGGFVMSIIVLLIRSRVPLLLVG